jgi:hypothetical protein
MLMNNSVGGEKMSERTEIFVRYIACPSMTNGMLGFYEYPEDKYCVSPNYPYPGGYYHIGRSTEEVDEIARDLKIKTRDEFRFDHDGPWKNDYIAEFTNALGKRLMGDGFKWTFYPNEGEPQYFLFTCPHNEFQPNKIKPK